MANQAVIFDNRSFLRYLAFVERGEQRFVLAKTLTQIAAEARMVIKRESQIKWTVRSQFVLRGYRINAATKSTLVSRMGHIDWYAADQLDSTPSARAPRSAKWRYIPMPGIKKTKVGRVVKRLSPQRLVSRVGKPNSKLFFFHSKQKKTKFLARRETKRRLPIQLLYKMVPTQRIMPKVSMVKTAEIAAATGQEKFNKNMQQAIRPFR